MMHEAKRVFVALRTMLRRARGASDVRRWSKPESLHASWDARTKVLASFVRPGQSVLEFGAGRRVLERHLPPGTSYTPSDLVDRGPGTIVCDLNAAQLPPFPPHDVCVFSGVLEYVNDLPRLLAHLHGVCGAIVASYAPRAETGAAQILERRRQGWVNDYTVEELVAVFAASGFRCSLSRAQGSQQLFSFVRETTRPEGPAD